MFGAASTTLNSGSSARLLANAISAGFVGSYDQLRSAAAPIAGVAQAPAAAEQRELLHRHFAPRPGTGNRLRERSVSEPARVLFTAHCDLHGVGQCLHAAMRILLGPPRGDSGIGSR